MLFFSCHPLHMALIPARWLWPMRFRGSAFLRSLLTSNGIAGNLATILSTLLPLLGLLAPTPTGAELRLLRLHLRLRSRARSLNHGSHRRLAGHVDDVHLGVLLNLLKDRVALREGVHAFVTVHPDTAYVDVDGVV